MTMAGRQAKILSAADVNDLLLFASCTRNPLRNRVLVLLSAKAGLRASEIANLTWDMVLGATGQIGGSIELHDVAAKKGGGRMIPIHPELRAALVAGKEFSREQCLQRVDAVRDRRLRDVQPLRRAVEIARFHQVEECLNQDNLHECADFSQCSGKV